MSVVLRKIVSVILIISMVVSSVIPRKIRPVYASEVDIIDSTTETNMESSIDYPSTTDIDFDISNIGIVSEDESKRGYDTKTFKKEDGSYLLAAYNQVIHYEENGVFKNINNSLVYDEGSSEYENSANKFKIKFPKEIKENKKFKLTLDEYKIEWQILDIDASVIEVEENQEKSNNIKELTNVNQKVIYKDIQPNVDLEYILSGNKIKENIILNKYIEDFSMTFEYQVKDLKLVRNEAGSYVFENGKGEVVFNFEQLYMVDKNHHTSNNVEISVNEVKEDLYQVTIIPDQIFLESAEYPIIIDPTITCGQEDSVLEHKYVNDYSQVVDNELMVGSSAGIIFRSYLNINIDQIKNNINFTSDKRITYANLNMSTDMDNTQDQLTILISEVLDSISYESIESITDITENSEIFDFNIIEYQLIGNTTLNFDIYAGFNDWMNQPETHRIIELKQLNEFSDVYMTFNPLGDNDSLSPFLELGYIDKAGIKDYWTYNTQDVGRVGTGYVSDYTGNLTFIRNDINFNTELQSLLAPFAYNSLDLETNLGYGIGWNTYYNSRVDSDPVTGQHYVEDYTGYKAYYIEPTIEEDLGCDISSNEYDCYVNIDDGKTILKEDKTTGEYDVISELEGTTYHYNNSGYLIGINYKNENATTETTITIQRNPNRIYQVEAVTDSSGNMIDFVYDISTENLDYLILKTSSMGSNHLERVDYSIDSNDLLNDVTYYKNYDLQDGETLDYNVHYDYEYRFDRYHLKTGYVLGGEKIDYEYQESSFLHQIYGYETYNNEQKISDISYTYSSGTTTITNHLGDYVKYAFDHFGHTVQVQDNNGNMSFYSYRNIYHVLPGEEIDYRNNHQLISKSSPRLSEDNYIQNGSFEDGLSYWNDGFNSNVVVETHKKYLGDHALWMPGDEDVYQNITLDKGVYILSANIYKTSGSNEVYLEVDNNQSEKLGNSYSWQQVDMPLYIEEDETSISVKLVNDSEYSVYFDNITLTKGLSNKKINIIDNDSFEESLDGWITSDGYVTREHFDYGPNDDSDLHLYPHLGNDAVKIEGSNSGARFISTKINKEVIDAYNNDGMLYVGGWANVYTAPRINNANLYNEAQEVFENGKIFMMSISFYDDDDLKIEADEGQRIGGYVFFNQSRDSWQFKYTEVSLPETYAYMTVTFMYQGIGEVLFDGATVFYDASEMYYTITREDIPDGDLDETNNEERIDKIEWTDGRMIDYIYSEENFADEPIGFIDEDGNRYDIEKDNEMVDFIVFNNVKYDTNYTAYGQSRSLVVSGKDGTGTYIDYFDTSTTYTTDYQYISSQTDAFGNITNYQTDVMTGLLEYIENAKDVKTEYEYNDDGLLKKVKIDQSSVYDSYVIYVYNDNDQLIEIKMNHEGLTGYSYHIHYDSVGRMDYVEVNNQTIMSYDYYEEGDIETGEISSQTYGNGDQIVFTYTDDGLIEKVSYQGYGEALIDYYTYLYDDENKLAVYHDLVNGYTEYYEYHPNGDLAKITNSDDDVIEYAYDGLDNLSEISYEITDIEGYMNYHYQSELSNHLYAYTSYNQGGETIQKNYDYEDDAINRLQSITYTNNSNSIMVLGVEYEGTTTRINGLEYSLTVSSIGIEYCYQYDELGNITNETYINDSENIHISKSYIYDDMNQLVQEHSRDDQYTISSTYAETNYSIYYSYDLNGNLIRKKQVGYYCPEDIYVPGFSETNSGLYDLKMYYNTFNDYNDIYFMDVGDNLDLSFRYYDSQHRIFVYLSTQLVYSNLNVNEPGYYYNYYNATDGLFYNINFRVVIKVGEISTENSEITYSYNNSWLDQLESYVVDNNTSEITYDDSGNPIDITNFKYEGTLYNHAILEWEGRKLTNIKVYNLPGTTNLEAEIWYTYNDQGLRIEKLIEDDSGLTKYEYKLSGDLVLLEIVSGYNDSTQIYDELYKIAYSYDYDGTPIGFTYIDDLETTDYIYVKNLMGDITHITDLDGNIVVEYSYDAYGNITQVQGDDALTIGEYNSLRYRSYIYDEETAFYYLQSRYYKPEIGRFINADGLLGEVGNIQTHNMYAYCANNPVMFTDSTGFITENTKKIVIGAAIIATLAFFTVVSAGTLGAGFGAILSTMTGTGVGGLTGILASATVSSAVTALIGGVISGSINRLQGGKFEDGFSQGFMMGAITGGLAGGLGAGLSSSIKNTFASHAFMNGTISMTITSMQGALTNTFSLTDTVISFGFGYFGGGFFRNMYGLKSIGTGLGLSLGEAGVGHFVHEVFPDALFIDFRSKLVGVGA